MIEKIQMCIAFISSSGQWAAVTAEEAIEVDNEPFAILNSFCLFKIISKTDQVVTFGIVVQEILILNIETIVVLL